MDRRNSILGESVAEICTDRVVKRLQSQGARVSTYEAELLIEQEISSLARKMIEFFDREDHTDDN